MMLARRIYLQKLLIMQFIGLFVAVGLILIIRSFAATAPVRMGDINHDGTVNVFDLSLLLAKWQTNDTAADLNHDGTVNVFDLSLLLNNWSAPSPSITASPQPTPAMTTPVPAAGNLVSVSTAAQLQAALTGAKPGDTIKMADGTYSGHFVATADGTSTANIRLMGGRGAIIDGGPLTGGYSFHLGTANSAATVSYWRLEGFTVTGGQKGIILDNAQHVVISNLLIHQTGEEGVHLRNNSSDNLIEKSTITKTGQSTQAYGEGIYVGSAISNWSAFSQGMPDHSNRNQIVGNSISFTGAENIDIKEGTHAGVISANLLDGSGMCWNATASCNFADSMIDVKGEGWLVQSNSAAHMHATWSGGGQTNDGFQIHVISGAGSEGSGTNNTFIGNTINDVGGYGFNFQAGATGSAAKCNNVVSGAANGFSNIPCQL